MLKAYTVHLEVTGVSYFNPKELKLYLKNERYKFSFSPVVVLEKHILRTKKENAVHCFSFSFYKIFMTLILYLLSMILTFRPWSQFTFSITCNLLKILFPVSGV